MKKEFEIPELSIYSLLASDIITTSSIDGMDQAPGTDNDVDLG